MSLHIDMTEEAYTALVKQRRLSIIYSWVVSILSFTLLAIIFLITKIYIMGPIESSFVVLDAPSRASVSPEPEMMPSSSSSSAAPSVSILTSQSMSDVSLPVVEVPEMSNTLALSSINIGVGIDFGDIGSEWGTDGGGFGGGSPAGSTLAGSFYDTKLNRSGKPTNLSEKDFLELLNNFITRGWNENLMRGYYKSPTQLYISHFYISKSPADAAPEAFKCPPNVKGSRWVAIYRGNVVAPVTGNFRFVGFADDAMVVRFNGENVFDYGWYQIGVQANTATGEWQNLLRKGEGSADLRRRLKQAGINEAPMKFYQYSSTPHWNRTIGGMGSGKIFSVKEGEVYPIEVLVSEIPGGAFGMCLLIEEVGVAPHATDAGTGTPVLNLFRTNFSVPSEDVKKDNPVPFLEDSYIWRVVN